MIDFKNARQMAVSREVGKIVIPGKKNNLVKKCPYQPVFSCILKGYWVLYMSFDRFLLAFESRDLTQADKSIIRMSFFPSFNF